MSASIKPKNTTKPNKLSLWLRSRPTKAAILISALFLSLPGSIITDTWAAFTLNWKQDYSSEGATFIDNDAYFCDGFSYMSCNGGGNSGWGGGRGSGSDSGTAFLQETLRIGGQTYFHLIVGDYTKDSMAQEVFIHVSGGNSSNSGITFSDSLCGSGCASDTRNFDAGDALNSNSNFNGNGGGNPNSVMMQQVVKDGTINEVFLKDSFSQKPLISQTISTSDININFVADMRGSNYSQLAPISPANFTLTQTLLGANRNGTSGDFNVQTQGQSLNLTAGGFIYTPTRTSGTQVSSSGGSGGWGGGRSGGGNVTGDSGGGGGTYTYVDPFKGDSFQPLFQDYAAFCDPSQNSNSSGGSRGGGGFGGFGSGGGAACGGSSDGSTGSRNGFGGGGW